MSDKLILGQRVATMDKSPEFDAYTRVVIWLDSQDDNGNQRYVAYPESEQTTGRTLELTCPWGTADMAQSILSKVSPPRRAFQYQPYTATGAMLDPTAEVGDGVSVKDIYSGIYNQTEHFGGRHLSDIEAPTEEEIDHEFPFEASADRKAERRFAQERAERIAELKVKESEIQARVAKTYDSKTEAFGWRLTEDQFLVYGGSNVNNPVLKVTADGLQVKGSGTFTGTVTASAGKIGNFTIKDGKLYYEKTSISDANKGVYLGSDGIALGKSNAFKVDSSGNLTIGNGVFKVNSSGSVTMTKGSININNGAFYVDTNGNLTCNSGTFKGNVYAKNIKYGTSDTGYLNGNGISKNSISGGGGSGYGQIAQGTIQGWNVADGTLKSSKLYDTYLTKSTYDKLVGGEVTASEIKVQELRVRDSLYWGRGNLVKLYAVQGANGGTHQCLGIY